MTRRVTHTTRCLLWGYFEFRQDHSHRFKPKPGLNAPPLEGIGSIVPALAKNARTGHPQFWNAKQKFRSPGHPPSERDLLVEEYRVSYGRGKDGAAEFDSARLLAFLEHDYPAGLSWRQAERIGSPFPPHIEGKCVRALKEAGIHTANMFRRASKSASFKRAIRHFASLQSVAVSGLSHLALSVLAVASRKPRVAQEYFPDMAVDPVFASVIAVLSRKR